MARFTQYPTASTGDYADATTFLIANSDGEIKQASLEGLRDIFGSSIQSTSLSIASADVLQLNSTPLTIVAAQGAGTIIEVVSAVLKIDFNSVAYATNTTITLLTSGAIVPQADNSIDASVSRYGKFRNRYTSGEPSTVTQLIENAALTVTVDTGDPTAGDSNIEIFVIYRVINI